MPIGEDAHAVELELVKAIGLIELGAFAAAQHRHHVARWDFTLRRAEPSGLLLQLLAELPGARELFQREAAQHAEGLVDLTLARVAVLLLHEQPLVAFAGAGLGARAG